MGGPLEDWIMIPSCPLLTQCGSTKQETSRWKKSSVQTTAHRCLRCTPWASVISHPHCFWTIGTNLPSGLDRLCWAGRGGIVQLSIVSPLRQATGGHRQMRRQWSLSQRRFIGMTVYRACWKSEVCKFHVQHRLTQTAAIPLCFLYFYLIFPPTWVMSSETPTVKCRGIETLVIRF